MASEGHEIVMITWSIPSAGTSVGNASIDPSTLSPLITAPCSSGSSSTNLRGGQSNGEKGYDPGRAGDAEWTTRISAGS